MIINYRVGPLLISFYLFITHVLSTISIGTPGFTNPIFMYSLPRSIDMTASEAKTGKIMVTVESGLLLL